MRKVIAGLDIGSGLIKLVVGEIYKGRVQILTASSVESAGIENGFVVNPEIVIGKLQELFKKCEDMIGLKIKEVLISVPSDEADFFFATGSTKITNENHTIEEEDIVKAMQNATKDKVLEDREIVSITPTAFKVDGDMVDINPIDMEGEKLSLQCLVITIPRKNIYTLAKCLNKINVKVVDYTFSSIANYNQFKKAAMSDLVGAIIDIGDSRTTVSIFNQELLTNTSVINIGAKHILKDLHYMFKITKRDALEVMNNLCLGSTAKASAKISKDYTNADGNTISITEYEASEIASARLEEILTLAKKEINALTKKEIHYIMVTGGVSDMTDFTDALEKVFNHNAKLGIIKELGVRQNYYSVALGLIKYYDEKTKIKKIKYSIFDEDEVEELSSVNKKVNFGNNSILGKLFGYFFDN